ncbi:MAG: SusC/RagA family TonB-linked outer membrane protein [Gemmatimonas sp.]
MFFRTPPRAGAALPMVLAAAGLLGASAALAPGAHAQTTEATQPTRRARLTGIVLDVATNQPLAAANVFILGTPVATSTGPDGRFVIPSAPVGLYTIEAKKIGYAAQRFENTRLRADSVTTVEFKLTDRPTMLDQVTVSGTVDATSVTKSTLAISTLSQENLPVAATGSAANMLTGKVAGMTLTRTSGAPGAGVNIVLRTPIGGIDQNGGASGNGTPAGPLFIVDGVFLNQTQQVTTQDIEALDIANIEVIKGAAAASLYGARAAAGVIAITTNRGKNLALGTTQFSFRSEYGFDQFNDLPKKNTHHQFRQDAQGNWLNAQNQIVPRSQRATNEFGIMDQPYTSPLYDNIDQIFRPGRYNTQTATVQYNSAPANYNVQYSRTVNPGTVKYNEGIKRQSVRVNVDARVTEKVNVSISANHSRVNEDVELGNGSFNNFFRIDNDVNLLTPDPFPKMGFPYLLVPDSVTNYVNPLFTAYIADNVRKRARTLINVNGSYRPFQWLSFNADASYDRGDLQRTAYTARGTPQVATSGVVSPAVGTLTIETDITDQYRMQGGLTLTKSFGPMVARLTDFGVVSREQNPYLVTQGTDFLTEGVKAMSQARTKNVTSQSYTDRRAIQNVTSLNISISEKYIGDFLVNREGSSLFGAANRWNTFGRASAAWLIGQESWFPFSTSLSDVKIRYSWGVAGQNPGFSQQYEALSSDGSGGITRGSLGNANILPTKSFESEVGLDLTYRGRLTGQFTYVQTKVRDAFIAVPAPAVSGYATVTANPGLTTGNTIEATINGQILTNPRGLQWNVNLVADHSRNIISQFRRTCFDDRLNYRCDGVRNGTMWGNKLVSNKNDLLPKHAGSHSQFDVNDEGWVVAVGEGNTWRDGIAKKLWGTTVNIDGTAYPWGRPIVQVNPENGQLWYGQIGDGNPDMKFGLQNNFRYKNIRLNFLVNGQLGGNVYSNSEQTYYTSGDAPEVDQFGRPDELKKPVLYYNALANNNNLYLQNFVGTGTYAALSEVLLGYTMDAKQFTFLRRAGITNARIDLIGRNLKTFTKYTGFNVQAGQPMHRFDDATYPLSRTWTGAITLTF